MRIGKPLIVVGLALAFAAVVVTGTAFAQTPTPDQQAKTNYQQYFLDRLANALGTTTDKLKSAFTQARNETVDQAVKDGKLSLAQADKIKAQQGNIPFGFRFGGLDRNHENNKMVFMGGGQIRDAVAKALGMTTDELTSQLRSGKTLADLAKGKEQAVKDAIVAAVKAQTDQAVKNGKMTQEQADKIVEKIQNTDLNNLLGRGAFMRGVKPEGFKVKPHNGKAPTATPAPTQ